ncbi:hypothetical protein PanWU01x14_000670 [Parasponia andersonii]|uniref:Uncharacterized protein n=1 Tax=Parasponia andersonii TaxID=3476 RepID=A0A2P5E4Q7_PARAD|nr:hypothetical protein PanWU01x14_000670 [Parasponia andersonii]
MARVQGRGCTRCTPPCEKTKVCLGGARLWHDDQARGCAMMTRDGRTCYVRVRCNQHTLRRAHREPARTARARATTCELAVSRDGTSAWWCEERCVHKWADAHSAVTQLSTFDMCVSDGLEQDQVVIGRLLALSLVAACEEYASSSKRLGNCSAEVLAHASLSSTALGSWGCQLPCMYAYKYVINQAELSEKVVMS